MTILGSAVSDRDGPLALRPVLLQIVQQVRGLVQEAVGGQGAGRGGGGRGNSRQLLTSQSSPSE